VCWTGALSLEPYPNVCFYGYFGGRVSLFAQDSWTILFLFMLPSVTGVTRTCNCTHLFFFGWDGVFLTFWQGWFKIPIFLLSASHIAWGDRCAPLYPNIGWNGVLWTPYLCWPQTLILLISVFQVTCIRGLIHYYPAISIFLWSDKTNLSIFLGVAWEISKPGPNLEAL
jgi:hypothetical protein